MFQDLNKDIKSAYKTGSTIAKICFKIVNGIFGMLSKKQQPQPVKVQK